MTIVGCYTADIYCDEDHAMSTNADVVRHRAAGVLGEGVEVVRLVIDNRMGQFTGHTRGQALRAARQAGWYVSISRDRVLCPLHRSIGVKR